CAVCGQRGAPLVAGSTPGVERPDEGVLTLAETLPSAGPHGESVQPGSRIGRFVIGESLGVGGMGVVYAAEAPELGSHVAVKVLRGAVARDSALAARRIMREARLAARVAHPNLVSIYE